MYMWYLNHGHTLDELLNLGYYERQFYIAAAEKFHEDDINEKIDLNPLWKRKKRS